MTSKSDFLFQFVIFLVYSILLIIIAFATGSRPTDFGPDTYSYYRFFESLLNNSTLTIDDIGFIFLARLVSIFTNDPSVFLVVVSSATSLLFLFYVSVASNIYDLSSKKEFFFQSIVISIILLSPFFFSLQTNIIRQGLACPLILIASYYIYKKNIIKFFVFSLIACLIHSSSLLFVIPLLFLNYSVKTVFIVFVLLFALYLFDVVRVITSTVLNIDLSVLLLGKEDKPSGYKDGVRYDFATFIFVLVFIEFCLYRYFRGDAYPVKLLMLLSFPFLLVGFIPFSDRFLVCVFALFPFVIARLFVSIKLSLSSRMIISFVAAFVAFFVYFYNLPYIFS